MAQNYVWAIWINPLGLTIFYGSTIRLCIHMKKKGLYTLMGKEINGNEQL